MSAAEATLLGRAHQALAARRFGEAEALFRTLLGSDPEQADLLANLGVCLKAQGRLAEAEAAYRRALDSRPEFVEVLNNLANTVRALGRPTEAEALYLRVLEVRPEHVESHVNLALLRASQERAAEAEAPARRAVELRPDLAETHNVLGLVLKGLGRHGPAAEAFGHALERRPGDANAWNNLGNLWREEGRLDDAEAGFRNAIAAAPGFAEAHNNLGNTLFEQGRFEQAEDAYRRALSVNPGYVEACFHLGTLLAVLGRAREAEAVLGRGLEIRPGDAACIDQLAMVRLGCGDARGALATLLAAGGIGDRPGRRSVFVDCLAHLRVEAVDPALRAVVLDALTRPWGDATRLSRIAGELLRIEHGLDGWPDGASTQQRAAMTGDPLLLALLAIAPVRDPSIERHLTQWRRELLLCGETDSPDIPFLAALADQCFINEYVFAESAEEATAVASMRDRLDADLGAGRPIDVRHLLLFAAYQPLADLPHAERLLEAACPLPEAIRRRHVREPLRERTLARQMPRLTGIDDAVSLRVERQYAEHPYPRWIEAEFPPPVRDIDTYLRGNFPRAAYEPLGVDCPDILIAGCGTGRQAIAVARRTKRSKILAIDLSRTSLAYARRKTEELGIATIEYAQADLLRAREIGRRFHIVESTGVLHHLADPEAGLAVLADLVRPGGLMVIALYSRLARRAVFAARAAVAAAGPTSAVADIRARRQDVLRLGAGHPAHAASRMADFHTLSACRDLLFHVQETCFDLTEIAAMLDRHRLRFLGFEIAPPVRQAYRDMFPDDPAATDLGNWHRFEASAPDAFAGMYQLWVQKPAE